MTSPIRPEIHALTMFEEEPGKMTMRQALEWHKNCVRILRGTQLRGLEQKELDGRWVFLVNAIAEREGVPTGSLSYFLGELSQAEMGLAETAKDEAEVALGYQ